MEMLILQKDYIIVELETKCGVWYLPCGEGENYSIEVSGLTGGNCGRQGGPMGALDFTIQCNGRLKKHRTLFEMTEDKNCSQYLNIKDWGPINEAVSLLSSLGYELDIFEMQELIKKRLSCVTSTTSKKI